MRLNRWIAGAAALMMAGLANAGVTKTSWGKTAEGTPVELYTLTDSELTVTITTFGARVVGILAPDRAGKKADVVLGYDNVGQYEADKSTYFGAIVGRYGNRIAKGTFSVDGKTFNIPLNNNGNALHGGPAGFSTKVWTGKEVPDGVAMTLVSPDGDMGFPGELTLHVTYKLVGKSLRILYSATTTKPTVINVTNHAYFNLAGEGTGTILGEQLLMPADKYTPTDAGLIPTGELAPVQGTPFDFRKATVIGARINDDNVQLKQAGGYDHNFVLNGNGLGLHVAAELYDPVSGRTLKVTTTEPGVQFYSGNFLDGTLKGKSGAAYAKNFGLCLETQHFPDSPNQKAFPSTELLPGHTMRSATIFTFGVRP